MSLTDNNMIALGPLLIFLVIGLPMVWFELKFRIIPDLITILSTVLLLLFYIILLPERLIPGIIGSILGFSFFLIIYRIKNIGFGDVKYSIPLGLLTGYLWVFPALAISSILSILCYAPFLLINKNYAYKIPFGPFMLAGGVLSCILSLFIRL